MLQQTQVATVIDYYNRWMKKWPTVEDLSKASLEEVNEMWSGLGYYSRGRRLLEGAQKVVKKLNGVIPLTANELIKELPGVGKYTAGAIASIAHQEVTGLVDGNVIRVFARLRCIGSNVASQATIDLLWELANSLVDKDRPGDFNQALMELGATICVPRQPTCKHCPIQDACKAFAEVKQYSEKRKQKLIGKQDRGELTEIEDLCKFCLPSPSCYDPSLQVMNYPQKVKKKAAKQENYSMAIVSLGTDTDTSFLLIKRPAEGLLANMWELPNITRDSQMTTAEEKTTVLNHLNECYSVNRQAVQCASLLGQVTHMFSHIHHHYNVWKVDLSSRDFSRETSDTLRWLPKVDVLTCGITKTVRKCFKLMDELHDKNAVQPKGAKRRKDNAIEAGKRQKTLDSMFTLRRR